MNLNPEKTAPLVGSGEDVSLRGSHIEKTLNHGEGAFAKCSYCGRYSDNFRSLRDDAFPCDCGKAWGWCGSFRKPTSDSKWSEAS